MNATSGIFTAPRNGIYSFHFSCLSFHYLSDSMGGDTDIEVSLMQNGKEIGRSQTRITISTTSTLGSKDEFRMYDSKSLHSTLELKKGE